MATRPRRWASKLVIQQMLDDQTGTDITPLVVPDGPVGFNMPLWTLDEGALLPAIVTVAALAASVTRYRYDEDDVNRFTFFTPQRNPTTPDWEASHTEWTQRPSSKIEISPIRNFIPVKYPNGEFGTIETVISPAAEPTTVSVASYVATFSASPGATIAERHDHRHQLRRLHGLVV
jgi:hypothetical protein